MEANIIFQGFKLNVFFLFLTELRSEKVVILFFDMNQKNVLKSRKIVSYINEEKRSLLVTVQ